MRKHQKQIGMHLLLYSISNFTLLVLAARMIQWNSYPIVIFHAHFSLILFHIYDLRA